MLNFAFGLLCMWRLFHWENVVGETWRVDIIRTTAAATKTTSTAASIAVALPSFTCSAHSTNTTGAASNTAPAAATAAVTTAFFFFGKYSLHCFSTMFIRCDCYCWSCGVEIQYQAPVVRGQHNAQVLFFKKIVFFFFFTNTLTMAYSNYEIWSNWARLSELMLYLLLFYIHQILWLYQLSLYLVNFTSCCVYLRV